MSWFTIAQRYYDPDDPGNIEEYPGEQEMPVITPDNVGDYIEPEEDEQYDAAPPPGGMDSETTFLDEVPGIYEDEESIIEEAIKDQQCIAFEYTTRKGRYTGFRVVEPHGTFVAGTGNNLLVSFDRARQSIRAFIIDNIHQNTLKVMPGKFYSFETKFIFNPY